MEHTLGHLGKDPGHGINPVLRIHRWELDHFGSVFGELSAEEGVSEEDLADNVDEVERLAEKELERPHLMIVSHSHALFHVVRKLSRLLISLLVRGNGIVQSNNDTLKKDRVSRSINLRKL